MRGLGVRVQGFRDKGFIGFIGYSGCHPAHTQAQPPQGLVTPTTFAKITQRVTSQTLPLMAPGTIRRQPLGLNMENRDLSIPNM